MDLMTQFFVTVALVVCSGGIGYYMGERGFAGVQIDMNNVKIELEKVKNLVASKTIPQAVTIVTPGTGPSPAASTPAVAPAHI